MVSIRILTSYVIAGTWSSDAWFCSSRFRRGAFCVGWGPFRLAALYIRMQVILHLTIYTSASYGFRSDVYG